MSRATGDDRPLNPTSNEPLNSVLERHRLSRRTVLRGGLGAVVALIAGTGMAGMSERPRGDIAPGSLAPPPTGPTLGFASIPGAKGDACTVAEGYRATVLAPWGTPLNERAGAWRSDGGNTADEQANAMGMHHDGMHFFPLAGSATDGLLVVNHEYIDPPALHPAGPTTGADGRRPAEEVRKEIHAHGVSVVRIRLVGEHWQVVANDPLNRRFTTASVMEIAGPLRGAESLRTAFSPEGTRTRGTNNNCGNGHTPWGTYLTCEENWPGIFLNRGPLTPDQLRLGIGNRSLYGWESAAGDASEREGEFARFDLTPQGASAQEDYRNEAAGYGYIVEIDPHDATTRAVKRTALGRFRHENCCPGQVTAGQPVVFYMGDDTPFEYLYKFESTARWDPADAEPQDRLAIGAKYMDDGTLYVARFAADGTGTWLPLTPDSRLPDGQPLSTRYPDLPAILLDTRRAADALGATPMDRPEWTAVDPLTGVAYLSLTNNAKRTTQDAANPRPANVNGHILRWRERDDRRGFDWEIFAFGADAAAGPDINRSGLTEHNQFASPDGLRFDARGILWIETDNGDNAVAQATNDQLLAVVPSNLRDARGQPAVLDASNQAGLRRFFVGPDGCEITGLAFTPDHTTLFLNVQHPANWPCADEATVATPAGTRVRPRAATVAIRRLDGGEIGL